MDGTGCQIPTLKWPCLPCLTLSLTSNNLWEVYYSCAIHESCVCVCETEWKNKRERETHLQASNSKSAGIVGQRCYGNNEWTVGDVLIIEFDWHLIVTCWSSKYSIFNSLINTLDQHGAINHIKTLIKHFTYEDQIKRKKKNNKKPDVTWLQTLAVNLQSVPVLLDLTRLLDHIGHSTGAILPVFKWDFSFTGSLNSNGQTTRTRLTRPDTELGYKAQANTPTLDKKVSVIRFPNSEWRCV